VAVVMNLHMLFCLDKVLLSMWRSFHVSYSRQILEGIKVSDEGRVFSLSSLIIWKTLMNLNMAKRLAEWKNIDV